MDVLTRLANSIVVPVVVLDKAEDAIPTAKAMAAGGVDTMEITFRTACAPEAIKAVAENCPEVLVGAGTIINVEQPGDVIILFIFRVSKPSLQKLKSYSKSCLRVSITPK